MNRNTESRFALNPSITINRSRFKRDSSLKTSWNVGDIVPFYLDEVLPGDTFDIRTSKVVRMPSMLTAPMDNLYLDTYYFFVPMRLVWSHSKEFFGENNESAWVPETEYTIPQITAPENGWNVGTIADYFGIPTGVDNLSVSSLPFRAYALICDQWFRSEVVSDPLNIPIDDSTIAGVNTGTFVTDVVKGGLPYKAAKYFDYFTGALPAPQKGPDVEIPLGSLDIQTTGSGSLSGNAPVITGADVIPLSVFGGSSNVYGMYFRRKDDKSPRNGFNEYANGFSMDSNGLYGYDGNGSSTDITAPSKLSSTGAVPRNLYASLGDVPVDLDITTTSTYNAGSINQLRLAFQIQKYYEKLARNGSRYVELIKGMFGVTSPDARLQRTEYLGGNRCPITINQIIQNSATGSGSTPQGTVTGQSLTTDVHKDFTRSFTEHGFVIGLMVARYDHTYQQGLDRLWSRKDKFDYYWPVFANIGEQAIKNKEIYAQGSLVIDEDTDKPYDEEVFGYQEAWADYRYKPNKVTGEMRSAYSASLDIWHFGDDYSELPTLSDDWIREDLSNVDRVLAVKSTVSNQLFADIYVQNKTTRAMPMYSIPGLIDHH